MTSTAPLEGTLGFGVGSLTPRELLRPNEDPFHSTVWFPLEAEKEAREFAAQFGYEVREGVAL